MANKELKSIRFPGLTDTYTVNSMPDGAEANMQLVTDADGVAKWEEKPFYSTQEEITVTWDGDTTDREEIIFEPTFYKVSDNIIPRENMIGATFTITFEGGSEEVTITDDILINVSEFIPGAWVLRYSDCFFMGSGPAFSKIGSSGGLYFTHGKNNEYASSLTFIGESINTIEQKYLPEIPAEKLPEIPAEKLPDVFDTKDLFVKLEDFSLYILTQSAQPSFKFSNVTYAELLDAAKKSKVILVNVSDANQIIPNKTSVSTDGDIHLEILFYYNGYIHAIILSCLANNTCFFRNTWNKAAVE